MNTPKKPNTSPAHDWRSPSGAAQTRALIISWIMKNRQWLLNAGLLGSSDGVEDFASELFVRLARRQAMPSRWDPERGKGWGGYVWLFCRTCALNLAKKSRKLLPLPEGEYLPGVDEVPTWERWNDCAAIIGRDESIRAVKTDGYQGRLSGYARRAKLRSSI